MTVDRRDWLYEEREIASLRAALAEERRVRRLLAEVLDLAADRLRARVAYDRERINELDRKAVRVANSALAESAALDRKAGEA